VTAVLAGDRREYFRPGLCREVGEGQADQRVPCEDFIVQTPVEIATASEQVRMWRDPPASMKCVGGHISESPLADGREAQAQADPRDLAFVSVRAYTKIGLNSPFESINHA
jgi:hypothetical protein